MNAISADKYLANIEVNSNTHHYYNIVDAASAFSINLSSLPVSIKILLENVLRHSQNTEALSKHMQAFKTWQEKRGSMEHTLSYRPARVLMQDFTGVPAIVDLAAMRDAITDIGGDPKKINPLCPVDLVVDHSVSVDRFGSNKSLEQNVDIEMIRNRERYQFLKWGQKAFSNYRVVPPGHGICHQVNLEHLAKVVWSKQDQGKNWIFPDTLVGTDSHTTMINALGVLGWGVGGIEAEAVMLGQSISLLLPKVVGFYLEGSLKEGVTATDLVLTICEALRRKGVVGKFVEFYGPGVKRLTLAERATIANMAPEFGATCAFFAVDEEVIRYLHLTGRDKDHIAMVEAYCRHQGLWHDPLAENIHFSSTISLDVYEIEPCLAGPKRPQDRVKVSALGLATEKAIMKQDVSADLGLSVPVRGEEYSLSHGDVVIAAITSCTNTSNPGVLIAAGLLAKKALDNGLKVKPWVKTSFAPGSKVVVDYLQELNLLEPLERLGFYLVGYGCTTCIGNSGPLAEEITEAIVDKNVMVSAVLSGNRNFEGRIHPYVTLNWLASPPLVIAYAIAGTTKKDLLRDILGQGKHGGVRLKDIWPSNEEVQGMISKINQDMFIRQYEHIFTGGAPWASLPAEISRTYAWQRGSTYIQKPNFFDGLSSRPKKKQDVKNARVLALLGDTVTTDHISPAGAIKPNSPAGRYLLSKQVTPGDFNSYGARRGNHEVMVRGTFANIRIQNAMVPHIEGGYTTCVDSNEVLAIYDAAMRYKAKNTPLVVMAGKEYGTGSSRDWAAKGTLLLGVKIVIAESFERIHRSNLVGMGVLPCEFISTSWKELQIVGRERLHFNGLGEINKPHEKIIMTIEYEDGRTMEVPLLARIDTSEEVEYYKHGGILQFVLRGLAKA
ncbi:MAG: aconitate hydratase AcnA [Pseudomonadota bacterium]|nr:aconitate hydratase AcnA [Pseudomonadota bacterium]